jgi:hypothetical protein
MILLLQFPVTSSLLGPSSLLTHPQSVFIPFFERPTFIHTKQQAELEICLY